MLAYNAIIMDIIAEASTYIPIDRRQALAASVELNERAHGAVLFADISGFTGLTDDLVRAYGPQRGVEEMTHHLNRVYDRLVAAVHEHGGIVIGFSGDGMTCWFDADRMGGAGGSRERRARATRAALACAHRLQREMAAFAAIPAGDTEARLAIKSALAAGPVRRLLVGDPAIQLIDVIAGAPLERVSQLEREARSGETVLDEEARALVREIGKIEEIGDWEIQEIGKTEEISATQSSISNLQSFLLPQIYARLEAGGGRFVAELWPAAALFLRFDGLDFDRDEQAGAKLDEFVRWVQQTLARYEGALIQLTTGDKGSYLYAAFGAPVAHSDDPARAVTAALHLIAPPAALGYRPRVQIGIARGRMRVGPYGSRSRQTYGVQGRAVNFAAQLMMHAQPGQIIADTRVAASVRDQCRVQALVPITPKGGRDPQLVFAVTGGDDAAPSLHGALYISPPVGRDPELAQMDAALEEALAGRGGILRVEGEAGIGKSHLVGAFIGRAMDRVLVAPAACQSTTQETPYYAARQIARRLFGLDRLTFADETEEIEHVARMLTQLNPALLVRMPLLGELLDLPIPENETTGGFDPRLRQAALYSLAVEIIQAVARLQPVLLVGEDVHWMDEASQGLMLALARVAEQTRILMLVTHRPPRVGATGFIDSLAATPNQRHIRLAELTEAGSAALIESRLGGPISPLALALVHAQAQGNPFFTEELVDALREAGHLALQDETWRLTDPLVAQLHAANCLLRDGSEWRLAPDASLTSVNLGAPDSIHGIVLARLDRLPEPAKLTLKVASVLGRVFRLDVLRRAHPERPTPAELRAQISLLQTRDFARAQTPEPVETLLFKHNITQEVAYQTLLETQRRELHGAAGQALESLAPDEVDQLALHFFSADLDAPRVKAKALRYLDAAGQRAKRDYANETALSYFDRALSLEKRWQWLKDRVDVLHVLGRRREEEITLQRLNVHPDAPKVEIDYLWGAYYEAASEYKQALAALAEARELSELQGDRCREARCLTRQGMIAWRRGDYDGAESSYGAALDLLAACAATDDGQREELPLAEADVRYGLGLVHRQQGRYGEAVEQLTASLELSRTANSRQQEALTLDALGGVEFLRRRYPQALDHYDKSLTIRRAIGDRAGEGSSLLNIAQVHRTRGDHGAARAMLEEALAIQQALGNRWWEEIIWNELGIVSMLIGRLDEAEERLRKGLRLATEIGTETGQAYVLCNLGQVLRDQGKLNEAEKILRRGLALAMAQQDAHLEALYLSELAILALGREDYAEAMDLSQRALDHFRQLDLRLSTTTDLTTLARASLALGRPEDAARYLEETLAILDECSGQGPDYPQRDYFFCYEILTALGRNEEAQRALEAAHRLLMAQAEEISDPAMRRDYLHEVAFNRAIVEQARAL